MRVELGRFLFASIILSVIPATTIAGVLCEGDEAFLGMGTTPHKQCISQHVPQFSDYDNVYEECKLVVYLTDLAATGAAEEVLEPAYRKAARGVKSCWANREPKLEFRLARYPYSSFVEWQKLADEQLREELGVDQRGVMFSEQRVFIYVVTDAAMAKATEFLTQHGVPEDAFDIDSRESEIRRLPSIAPVVHLTDQGEQLLLPAVYPDGKKGGELVLGQTTMSEAVQVLPHSLGYGPNKGSLAPRSARSAHISEDVHATLDRVAYTYDPAFGYLMITFDESERLISAHYQVREGQGKSLRDALSEITSLQEVHRKKRESVQRGRIGSCIVVDTNMTLESDGQYRLTGVHYFYTCEQ